MLRAQRAGGRAAVTSLIEQIIASIRAICMLTGCRSARELERAPRHIGGPLRAFLDDLHL